MAIKVNGTTVIDDSRNLTNVLGLKTIGGVSILGSGDIAAGGGGAPAGTITMITNTATLPTGYLECNGSEISQASYPGLVGMLPDFQVYTPSASSVTLFNNNWSSDVDIVNPAVTYVPAGNVYLSNSPAPDWQGGLFKALEINFSSAVAVDSAALFAAGMGALPSIWELRELSSDTVVLTKNVPAYIQDDSGLVAQYSNPANFTNVSTVVTSASYALFIGGNPGYPTDIGFTKFILRARLTNPGSLYLPTATSITSSSAVRPIMKI